MKNTFLIITSKPTEDKKIKNVYQSNLSIREIQSVIDYMNSFTFEHREIEITDEKASFIFEEVFSSQIHDAKHDGEFFQVENSSSNSFDVVFHDNTNSNSKGFNESQEYCVDYINRYNGSNESYFADYKQGVVQVVNNETSEVVFETEVK